jgi:hypothetical protein
VRLVVSVGLALLIGIATLLILHFGVRKLPLGWLITASVPSALALALVSLWTRVRLGNVFIGYVVALAAWAANYLTGDILGGQIGIHINPLLTLSGYTDRMNAMAAGRLDTTPYVDWWWVSKLALVGVSLLILASVSRRVERLVEGD